MRDMTLTDESESCTLSSQSIRVGFIVPMCFYTPLSCLMASSHLLAILHMWKQNACARASFKDEVHATLRLAAGVAAFFLFSEMHLPT